MESRFYNNCGAINKCGSVSVVLKKNKLSTVNKQSDCSMPSQKNKTQKKKTKHFFQHIDLCYMLHLFYLPLNLWIWK